MVEPNGLALLWHLVELIPIEIGGRCESAQLSMPCRTRHVFAIRVFRVEKDNGIIVSSCGLPLVITKMQRGTLVRM
jgi:hypothetical protein